MNGSSQPASKVPLKNGLFSLNPETGGSPRLVASRCRLCAEIFFPQRTLCQNCQSEDIETIELGPKGKIYSVTTVMQKPPGLYQGPVPYAFGWVELPEGVRVETLFTGCPPEELSIGMDVELVIETLHRDTQDRQVLCHMFRPVRDSA